jgi:hypothetical protein
MMVAALSVPANSSTQRRGHSKRSSSAASAAADKSAAEIAVGRRRIADQIKTLTHFVYLLAGIQKTMELSTGATASHEVSPAALELNDRNKAKIRASITTVRQGLEKLETDLRLNPSFKNYYQYLVGLANHGEAAEKQAADNRFDEAGKSLLKAVDQLTDALVAIR